MDCRASLVLRIASTNSPDSRDRPTRRTTRLMVISQELTTIWNPTRGLLPTTDLVVRQSIAPRERTALDRAVRQRTNTCHRLSAPKCGSKKSSRSSINSISNTKLRVPQSQPNLTFDRNRNFRANLIFWSPMRSRGPWTSRWMPLRQSQLLLRLKSNWQPFRAFAVAFRPAANCAHFVAAESRRQNRYIFRERRVGFRLGGIDISTYGRCHFT